MFLLSKTVFIFYMCFGVFVTQKDAKIVLKQSEAENVKFITPQYNNA